METKINEHGHMMRQQNHNFVPQLRFSMFFSLNMVLV